MHSIFILYCVYLFHLPSWSVLAKTQGDSRPTTSRVTSWTFTQYHLNASRSWSSKDSSEAFAVRVSLVSLPVLLNVMLKERSSFGKRICRLYFHLTKREVELILYTTMPLMGTGNKKGCNNESFSIKWPWNNNCSPFKYWFHTWAGPYGLTNPHFGFIFLLLIHRRKISAKRTVTRLCPYPTALAAFGPLSPVSYWCITEGTLKEENDSQEVLRSREGVHGVTRE